MYFLPSKFNNLVSIPYTSLNIFWVITLEGFPIAYNSPLDNIIISAHGNSIRSLLKYLFKIDDNEISKLEIPTGNPLLLKFEKKNIKEAKYLDQSRSRDLIKF